MKKSVKLFSILFISILFLSTFAHAEGTSAGETTDRGGSSNDDSDDSDDDSDDNSDETDDSGADSESDLSDDDETEDDSRTRIDCEVRTDSLKERIKCRLENKGRLKVSEEESLPESCRALTDANAERCKNFYNKIRTCYTKEGAEKDKCFKRVIGFAKTKISEEVSERNQKARDYAVALLYDLQEKAEKMNEEGKLTSEEAAELVEKITQIKTKILEGAKKDEVKTMLQELKQKWREYLNE